MNKQINNKKIIIISIISISIILIIAGLLGYNLIYLPQKHNNESNDISNQSRRYQSPTIGSDRQVTIPSAAKPIIYIYPEKTMELNIKLGYPQKITCSYPKYKDGWNIIANPDGKLIDLDTNRNLYSLYWEGLNTSSSTIEEGFVVKGSDTIDFLESKLKILGLNDYEAEEFIVYWLPKLQDNEYNLIRFATKEEIDMNMPLQFSTQPDSIIRVLMEYKPLNDYIEVPEQKLITPERKGFVVVEWGGSEIK